MACWGCAWRALGVLERGREVDVVSGWASIMLVRWGGESVSDK
jgi:hypothetical protein